MRKSSAAVAALGLAAIASGIALAARRAPAAVGIGTGVVDIETSLGFAGGAAAGTGMVLSSSGEVLTNNHVIRGATSIRVVVPASGRSYTARVVGYTVGADVAVLKLSGASGLTPVRVGDSAKLRVGQAVTAVGNAGGAGTLSNAKGKITGLGRTIVAEDDQGISEQLKGLVETNATLQPGDSGGPLVDASGRVIGMDTAASPTFRFRGAAGDGFAIPIAHATALATQIAAGHASASVHIGPTAFLGVQLASQDGGDVVVGVVGGSPANRIGLVPGDVITSFDGRAAATPAALAALVLHKTPGARVRIVWIDTHGSRHAATATLAVGPPQ